MVSNVLRAAPIVGRVTGFMSMIACGYIIYEILSDKKKQKRTYFRLLFGISVIEFFDGFAWFVSSWTFSTRGFCIFQGFLLQASLASILYTAFLSLFYLLSIKYNWSERRIGKTVEPWMHGISLCMGYGTALVGIFMNLYKPINSVCYIGRTPPNCKETYQYGYTDCIQGDNSSLFVLVSFTIWQWGAVLWSAVAMLLIWCHIHQLETKSAQYHFAPGNNRTGGPARRKNSKRFAKQGFLYVGVFYISQLFVTITIIWRQYGNPATLPVEIYLMNSLTFPLEGFLNFIIYMRPRMIQYLKQRRKNKMNQRSRKNGTNDGGKLTKVTEEHDTPEDNNNIIIDQESNNNMAEGVNVDNNKTNNGSHHNSDFKQQQIDEEEDLEKNKNGAEDASSSSSLHNNNLDNTTSASLPARDMERSLSLSSRILSSLSSVRVIPANNVDLNEIQEDESEQMNLGEY